MRFPNQLKILILFPLIFVCLQSIAQDKKQFIEYIKNVEKKLDSLNTSLMQYDAENQAKLNLLKEQNDQLSKNSKLLIEKRAEVETLNEEIKEKTVYIDSQETFLGIFITVAIVSICLVIALFTTIREKKKINLELADKNKLIQQKVSELKQKNKEITDSIKYAKKIQDAILPTSNEIKSAFPNSFIFYRPKDIISGDFYWLAENNNKIYFVTADCTGHGVPGALMSMLGISYLNEIVNEKKVYKTSDIMNELKKSIINSVSKADDGEGMKDGMDMALYSLDKKNLKLTYSAANNGLYIIRDNNIIKLNPDKQSVSVGPKDHLMFNEHLFDLKQNDFIITYSDGFADQFGGPKGKKYKYKQLQALLLQIQNKPINTIPGLLNSVFEKWKGALEQVDDVLIVGVRV